MGGRPKGLIEVDGEPVIARTLRLIEPLCERRCVVASNGAAYDDVGAPRVPDIFPARGPAGGLHAALRQAGEGWVCLVACDMPGLTTQALGSLLEDAKRGGADAVYYETDGRAQPFCAWWHTRVLGVLEPILTTDSIGLTRLLRLVRSRCLAAPDPRLFESLNTPEDMARWRGRWPAIQILESR